MRIAHQRFGEGVITDINTAVADHRISVDFDHSGSKVLLLKFAKFDII